MKETNIIEASRNSCAFHGALQTVLEIKGVVPIIHSTAGCAVQENLGIEKVSGCASSSFIKDVPCTNVIEKQVVFGGTSRLREQIKNTIKVVDGELYLVLSGCTTELVGDDIKAMAKEAEQQGYRITSASTPGFKGDIHLGHELVVKAIIDKLPKVKNEKIKGFVNIFGIIPKQDVFWQGNLLEIERILENIGLKVNTLFGVNGGVNEWEKAPKAELNIVVSPWGKMAAEQLQKNYGTPCIYFNNLPVGNEETSYFIEKIGDKLNLDRGKIDAFIVNEENKVNYYIDKIADVYYEYNFQKEFAIVGEGSTVLGISKFLKDSLGFISDIIIVTDNPADSYKEILKNEINNDKVSLYFEQDNFNIKELIRNSDAELILGSSLENEIGHEINVPVHHISFPIWDDVILDKTYIGYKGAVTLIEDLGSVIRQFDFQ